MLERQPAIDDISSKYRPIAELIGMEGLLRLVRRYGGYQLYIPKAERLLQDARDEEIQANFTGYNIDELARKYNLSTRHIRYIVAPVLKQVRARPVPGQVSMFEAGEQSSPDTLPEDEPFDMMDFDEDGLLSNAPNDKDC